jgi:hypothetical protein
MPQPVAKAATKPSVPTSELPSYVKPRELRMLADQLSLFRNNIDERLNANTTPRGLSSCRLFRFRNRVPEMRELFGKGFSMNLDPSFSH